MGSPPSSTPPIRRSSSATVLECAATPDAIHKLLVAGYAPAAILYYRGGMHDWITLGYSTVPGGVASRQHDGG